MTSASWLLGTCLGVEAGGWCFCPVPQVISVLGEQLQAREAIDDHRSSLAIAVCNVMSITSHSLVAGPPLEGERPSFSFALVTNLLPDRYKAKAY